MTLNRHSMERRRRRYRLMEGVLTRSVSIIIESLNQITDREMT